MSGGQLQLCICPQAMQGGASADRGAFGSANGEGGIGAGEERLIDHGHGGRRGSTTARRPHFLCGSIQQSVDMLGNRLISFS